MIDIDNRTNFNLPIDILEKVTEELTDKDFELIVDDNNFIADLNRTYRNMDKTTDVLSFPISDELHIGMLGTVVISIDYVFDGVNKFDHNAEDEFTLLFIHGLLHLLGFDHEIDNGEMREKEEEIINKYQLPKSLIVRNS